MTVNHPRPCVRCGRRPRLADLYLCSRCLSDPVTRAEILEAERAGKTYTDQRRYAIETFHWTGGWGGR